MTDRQLAVRAATEIVQPRGFDDPTKELIKKTVSDPRNPLTSDELALFLAVCQYTGLNPLNREIYPLKIDGRLTVWTGIDGHRRIAQASPRFRGLAGPHWCGPDGVWGDVWLDEKTPPVACRVGVYLPGRQEPTWGIAYFKNYRNRTSATWKSQPEQMLAVRAESFALRKCFSRELAGVALPDDEADERPGYVDAVGVIDEAHPDREEPRVGLSPRMQAITEEMDAAVADAEEPVSEYEREQPPTGPRWTGTPLGRQVSALVDALTAAGKKFSLPDDDAGDAELTGWIASKRTALGQGKAT